MKRLFIIVLLFAAAAFAQERKDLTLVQEKKAEPEYSVTRDFRSKVFEIRNRDPRAVASTLRLLGSGFKGADLNVNNELKTITVRDFPENVAAMEEAIKRLDRPVAETPDVVLKISLLIGSKGSQSTAPIPDELAPVVKQLQSTLRYANYGLITTVVQRTKPGDGIQGSGVAEPTLLGMTPNQERPVFYRYNLRNISVSEGNEKRLIDISEFAFSMQIPVAFGTPGAVQYQDVGFHTPVALREKEKVVIGTTTMGDKALIVVVTATIEPKVGAGQ